MRRATSRELSGTIRPSPFHGRLRHHFVRQGPHLQILAEMESGCHGIDRSDDARAAEKPFGTLTSVMRTVRQEADRPQAQRSEALR